ncbi:MAG TPA: ABC transporter substrate-binding protein [Chloroflexota bacterium]|nr:ABC transporter substrate-binding protein [Chloroflexota bacterium]
MKTAWLTRQRLAASILLGFAMAGCGGATSSPSPSAASAAAASKPSASAAAPASAGGASASTAAKPAAASNAAPSGKSVNVGVPVSLTGQFAAIGQSQLEGVQLAADEINKAGGVLGRPLKIVPVDASDPVDAVPAVRKMLATDNVSMSVGLSVKTYQTALPILNSAKMVSFTFIGSPTIDHTLFPTSFRMQPSDAVVGTAMAEYAKEKGYNRIALVMDAEEGAQTLIPPIEHAAKALGLQVVAKPALPLNVPSYQGEILQIVNAKPDAMLMQVDPQGAGTFFKQLQGLGGDNIPVIGSDLTSGSEWVKAVGADEASKHVVSLVSGGESSPAAKFFTPAYEKKFGHPARLYSSHFYDGTNVGALAMIAAKSTDPKVFVNSILDVTTPGADHTTVYTFADGAKLLAQGKKIKYSGAGSPMTFTKYHTVAGSFQAVQSSASGKLNVLATIPGSKLDPLMS